MTTTDDTCKDWKTIDFPNRTALRPTFKQKDNSVEKILDRALDKVCMTILSEEGLHDRRAIRLRGMFYQRGGCIFVHSNMSEIFDKEEKEKSGDRYDAVIITKERPVCVLTVVERGEIDQRTRRYNKIISNKLKLALLMFTDRNITTICTVVRDSVLKKRKLEKVLDDAKKAAYLLNPDKLYMDESKRDDVTRAFITCLAFMTSTNFDQDIIFCMDVSVFFNRYSGPKTKIENNELENDDIAKRPDDLSDWILELAERILLHLAGRILLHLDCGQGVVCRIQFGSLNDVAYNNIHRLIHKHPLDNY